MGKIPAPLLALSLLIACEPAAPPMPDIETGFELTDENGTQVTSDAYDGSLRLVFFGFTTCPDICPITLHNIAAALDALDKDEAGQVTVLFISVDPRRDTPERLQAYTEAIHPSIVGLTGTYDQIVAVTSDFRTAFGYSADVDGLQRPLTREEYEALGPAAAYTPFHGSQVFVLGRDGRLLDLIGYGSTPSTIEAKLRDYL